jgi:hypothetical protein
MKPRFLLAPTSFPSRMATSPLLATTFHHEGKIVHANFPSNTSTDILSMTTLQDSFTFGTSTCAFPKRTLHREGNIMHANSPSIIKASTRTSPLPTTTLHHGIKHNCIANNNYITS